MAKASVTRKIEYNYATMPVEGGMKVAARFHLGDHRYGIGNWKDGDWEFILERISHMEYHLQLFKRDGNKRDDNLGAMLWGGYMLAWYEANRPEVLDEALKVINQRKVTYYEQRSSESKSKASVGTPSSKDVGEQLLADFCKSTRISTVSGTDRGSGAANSPKHHKRR